MAERKSQPRRQTQQREPEAKTATRISVHLRLVNLGEEIVLDHVEGGFVQVYDIDYRGGSGLGQDYLVAFAVVEPITAEDADEHRKTYRPGQVSDRYADVSYPSRMGEGGGATDATTDADEEDEDDPRVARRRYFQERIDEVGIVAAAQEFGMSPSAVQRVADGLDTSVPEDVHAAT